MYSEFKNKRVAIFGGTGSIGQAILKELIKIDCYITVVSNNENELWETSRKFKDNDNIIYKFCDIRNYESVNDTCLPYIDYVFNCAAMKHVPICEENVINSVYTNIIGLHNIILGCKNNIVLKLIQISTDKAVEPTSVMGATKLIGERLCLSNNSSGITKISCVRFGNVYGSRGSIVPIIQDKLQKDKHLPLTDTRMKRYFIKIEKAAEFIINSMIMMEGGEIFVPEMEEIYIVDLFEDLILESGIPRTEVTIEEIGIRSGEKITEKLMTAKEEAQKIKIKGGYKIG